MIFDVIGGGVTTLTPLAHITFEVIAFLGVEPLVAFGTDPTITAHLISSAHLG
jgi:hypothetical protein